MLSVMQANRRFGLGIPITPSLCLPDCLAKRFVARTAEPEPASSRQAVYGVQYDIYKGRSAIQFKPIMPTYRTAADGNLELARRGCMLLELANSSGKRSYAWAEKITFAMSITELSQLFLTNAVLSGQVVDLFHDPGMGSATQGQVLPLKLEFVVSALCVGQSDSGRVIQMPHCDIPMACRSRSP